MTWGWIALCIFLALYCLGHLAPSLGITEPWIAAFAGLAALCMAINGAWAWRRVA